MKKTLLLVLAVFMAAGMVFAGGGQASSGGQTTTLNVWHIWEDESRGKQIEAFCKQFEAQNPGVKVVISTAPNDPYKTKLKTVTGDDFPDLFISWGGGWLKSFVDAGYVADITAEANAVAGQLNTSLVDLNRFDGKIYGIPFTAGTTILYYNKAIFAKYNLQPPQTWADMERVCQTLIANGVIPFAEANKTMWPGAQHFVLLSMRLGGGDIFTKAQNKEVKFTDPVFIKAGETLIELVNKGWYPAGVNGLDWDTGQSRIMLYTEQAAMLISTGGFISNCRNENKDFYDNKLGITLYPSIEGGKGINTDILAGNNSFSVSAKSKNPAMAKKLAIALGTGSIQQDMIGFGVLAAKPGVNITDVHVKTALDQLSKASYLQNYVDQTLSPELAEVHKATTQALFGKTMTPQQAAETMQRAFDSQ
jgi:raffinose/stachyose/melibiose transport system substrate-binding protein